MAILRRWIQKGCLYSLVVTSTLSMLSLWKVHFYYPHHMATQLD